MDPLLDLLRAMHLSGGVFLEAEFTAPWCVSARVGPDEYRPFLLRPSHLIAYHYVTEGRCLVAVDGGPAMEVRAGESVLLPSNDPHRLGSALSVPTVNAGELVHRVADAGVASRSAFADRFTSLVGESPMRYLARQRLRAAAQRLRESAEPITRVAFDVGYESEAAFSRAFKREFGQSPAAWRKG